MPNCFPKQLYHLTFPLTICECSSCSVINLALLSNNQSTIFKWSLLDCSFYSIDVYVYLLLATHCFGYCSFVVSLKIRYCESSNFVFFKIVFDVSGACIFPYAFQNHVNFSKQAWILFVTLYKLPNNLRNIEILTIFPSYQHISPGLL